MEVNEKIKKIIHVFQNNRDKVCIIKFLGDLQNERIVNNLLCDYKNSKDGIKYLVLKDEYNTVTKIPEILIKDIHIESDELDGNVEIKIYIYLPNSSLELFVS